MSRPILTVMLAAALSGGCGGALAQDATRPAATAPTEADRIYGLARQGIDLDAAERYAEAAPPLQEAYAVLSEHAPVENRWRQNTAISLAHALSELDREDEAIAILARENQALIDAGKDAAPDAPTVAYALAMLLYNDSRYAEAGPPARRACALYAMPEHGADAAKCRRLDSVRAAAGDPVELSAEKRAEAHAARDLETATTAWERGDYEVGDAAFGRLLGWFTATGGPEHEDTVAMRVLRARLWLSLGRVAQARDEAAEVYAIGARALGPAHEETLGALDVYADALIADGRGVEALAQIDAVQGPVEAQRGERSAEVVRLLAQRGDILLGLGRYEEAEAAYRASLARAVDLPLTDEDKVLTSASLGSLLSIMGRRAEARAILEPLVREQEALGVGDRPAVNQARAGLAEALIIDGDAAGAEALLTPLLTVWGPEGRKTMQSRAVALTEMALVRRQQGRLNDAIALAAEATNIMRERAPYSLMRIRAQRVQGILLIGLGRYVEAGEILRDTVALESRVLGDDHPESSSTLLALAEAQFEMGAQQLGRATMTRGIDVAERHFGRRHVATAAAYNQAALMEWNADDFEAAGRLIEVAVEAYTAALGPENPSTLLGRVNRAAIMAEQGRRAEAVAEYQTVLDLRQRVLGSDHPDVASLLNTIGQQMQPEISPEHAEELLRRAVEIGRARLPPDDPDRLLWETGLAGQLIELHRSEEALTLLREVGRQARARSGGYSAATVGETEAGHMRNTYRGLVIAAWRVAQGEPQ